MRGLGDSWAGRANPKVNSASLYTQLPRSDCENLLAPRSLAASGESYDLSET